MMYPYEDTVSLCGAKAYYLIVRGGGNPPNLTFACEDCKNHYVKSVKQMAQVMKTDTSNIELYRLLEEDI